MTPQVDLVTSQAAQPPEATALGHLVLDLNRLTTGHMPPSLGRCSSQPPVFCFSAASSVGAVQSNTPKFRLSQNGCWSRANASLSGLCFSAWLQPAHLKPVICGVKQLYKRALRRGCFSEQLVQRRACRSFHLHLEPKWEVKRPVGSSQFGSFLLNISQKPDSSGKCNKPMCGVMEPEAEVVRIGQGWDLGRHCFSHSTSREKKKESPLFNRVGTTCQGGHFVCQQSTYGNTSADIYQSNFWAVAKSTLCYTKTVLWSLHTSCEWADIIPKHEKTPKAKSQLHIVPSERGDKYYLISLVYTEPSNNCQL